MQIATNTCMTTPLKFMLFLATVLSYKLVILTMFAVYDGMISWYNLHQYFCYLQKVFASSGKKTMETRIIKNIFKEDVEMLKPKKHVN